MALIILISKENPRNYIILPKNISVYFSKRPLKNIPHNYLITYKVISSLFSYQNIQLMLRYCVLISFFIICFSVTKGLNSILNIVREAMNRKIHTRNFPDCVVVGKRQSVESYSGL